MRTVLDVEACSIPMRTVLDVEACSTPMRTVFDTCVDCSTPVQNRSPSKSSFLSKRVMT
ncbi:hypothetical protein A2U01_0098486 [Trifolium medium]|nr:hypothetical protein [Trifolium medium]